MSSEVDPAKLKVVELRAELCARGLDSKGNKAVLVKRLKDALEKELKKELPDTSIADTSTEDINTSQTEEPVVTEEQKKDEQKAEPSTVTKKDTKQPKDDKVEILTAKDINYMEKCQEPVKGELKEKKEGIEAFVQKKAKIEGSPEKNVKAKIVEEIKIIVKKDIEKKKAVKMTNVNQQITETQSIKDSRQRAEENGVKTESAEKKLLGKKSSCENTDEQMESANDESKNSESVRKSNEMITNDSQQRGDKRKRSPSPSRSQRRRSKSPIKEDEPAIDNSKVQLNWYDSDLHLQIDKESLLSGKPYHDGAFGYVWSGVRATHGADSGKVCYEVRITEELKWEDIIRQSDRGRRDRERRDLRRDRTERRGKSSDRKRSGDKKESRRKGKSDKKEAKEDSKEGESKEEKSNEEAISQEENKIKTSKEDKEAKEEMKRDVVKEEEIVKETDVEELKKEAKEDVEMDTNEAEDSQKEEKSNEVMEVDEDKDDKKTDTAKDKKDDDKEEKKVNKKEKRESKEKETAPVPTHLIRIGWSSLNFGLQLGESKFSYGYESSGKFVTDKQFSEYGKPFIVGDVVCAYLEFSEEAINIKYTLNGEELSNAISIPKAEVPEKDFSLFPHVLSRNYAFEVNLGGKEEPFFKSPETLANYVYIDKFENKVLGPMRPETRSDCEVIMMCGLPGSGKTHWVKEHVTNNPDKRYTVIGNAQLLEKMTVNGNPLKNILKGRWNVVLDKLSKCLNRLVEIAALRRRNYVIDQTNVFPSAQRRKMRPFEGFKRRAVIVVCGDEEQARRRVLQEAQDGKDVPNIAVYEMKANMSLPKVGDWLEEVTYVELDEQEAKTMVQKYNKEGRDNGFGSFSQRRDYRDDRMRWHPNRRNDYRGSYRDRNYASSRFDRGSKSGSWQSGRSSSWSRNDRRDSRISSGRSRDWHNNNRGITQRHQDRGRDRSSHHSSRDSYSRNRSQGNRNQSGSWQSGGGGSSWGQTNNYSGSQGSWQGQSSGGNWNQSYGTGGQGKWNYGVQGGYGQQQSYGSYPNWNYYGQYQNWNAQVESTTTNWNK